MVTLSFVLLFGAVGLLLSAATSALAAYFPWAGLAVGVLVGAPHDALVGYWQCMGQLDMVRSRKFG